MITLISDFCKILKRILNKSLAIKYLIASTLSLCWSKIDYFQFVYIWVSEKRAHCWYQSKMYRVSDFKRYHWHELQFFFEKLTAADLYIFWTSVLLFEQNISQFLWSNHIKFQRPPVTNIMISVFFSFYIKKCVEKVFVRNFDLTSNFFVKTFKLAAENQKDIFDETNH